MRVAGLHRDTLCAALNETERSLLETDDGDTDADETVIGDPFGLLGVSIEAEEDEEEVTVTITCDAIMPPSTISTC